jgi:hypothetical protein
MSKLDDLQAATRRRAEELLGRSKQQEADRLAQRDRARRLEAEKTARLKSLRLAKEAQEKQAAPPATRARRKVAK